MDIVLAAAAGYFLETEGPEIHVPQVRSRREFRLGANRPSGPLRTTEAALRNFHLTINGKRYAVSAERDPASNDLDITIDGKTHRVKIEEEEAASAAAPRPSAARRPSPRPTAGGGKILAPLQGDGLIRRGGAGRFGARRGYAFGSRGDEDGKRDFG